MKLTGGGECCGDDCCPEGQSCCNAALYVCCVDGTSPSSVAAGISGQECCVDRCCQTGWTCCGGTDCCDPQFCCANGECCGEPCEGCLDNGTLSGGTIDVQPPVVCLGDTITFTISGVSDSDGGIKRVFCSAKTWIPPGTLTYTWRITKPDGTKVPPADDPPGSGNVASVVADQPGSYSCIFTAHASRECPPDDLDVGPKTAIAFEITSQTQATIPSNRARTKLGIGETVTVSTNPPLTVGWSVAGGGTVAPITGTSTLFRTSRSPSTSTVTATTAGSMCHIDYTVVAPDGLTCAVEADLGCGIPGPPNNTIGARTKFACIVQPNDVSFYAVTFRENIPGDSWVWPDGTADQRFPEFDIWTVPEANTTGDTVSRCGNPIGRLDPPPPGGALSDFAFTVRVPEEYRNDDGNWIIWLPGETHDRQYRGADAASRVTINATNVAIGNWQGPWQ